MKILLLDSKEFENVDGKIFEQASYYSFNLNDKVAKTWSNGWCPVSRFKVDDGGNVYGRIANELVPSGHYNNVIVTTSNASLKYKYTKAMCQ